MKTWTEAQLYTRLYGRDRCLVASNTIYLLLLAEKNDHGHLKVKFGAIRDNMKSILSASVKRPGHTAVRQVLYNNLKYLDLRI